MEDNSIRMIHVNRFQVHIHATESGVTVLAFSGVLRIGDGTQALDFLIAGLAAQRATVILDLTDLHAVDSRGIGCLVDAFVKLNPRVRAVGVGNRLRPLVALCKLHTVFECCGTVEQAHQELVGQVEFA